MAANSIFIMTRFSVFEARAWNVRSHAPKGSRGWNLRAKATSVEDYRESLFSDERLSARLALFSTITAESLVRQQPCDADLHFVVLTSEDLPTAYRARLDEAMRDVASRSSFTCAVVDVSSERDLVEYADDFLHDHYTRRPDQRFATVRLDDDDALAASFCRRLTAHLDQGLCGYPVTFAYGYQGVVDPGGRVSDVRHLNSPKTGAGLAFTNAWSTSNGYADARGHVYNLGRHTKVDVADAVVVDTRSVGYFRTLSEHMDSRRQALWTDLPVVTQDQFAFDEFPWLTASSVDLPPPTDPAPAPFDPATATSARAARQRAVRELNQEIEALQGRLEVARNVRRHRTGPRRWLGRARRAVGRLVHRWRPSDRVE